jgi:hypothetical protein
LGRSAICEKSQTYLQVRETLRYLRLPYISQRFPRPRHHLDTPSEIAHGNDQRTVLRVPHHPFSAVTPVT